MQTNAHPQNINTQARPFTPNSDPFDNPNGQNVFQNMLGQQAATPPQGTEPSNMPNGMPQQPPQGHVVDQQYSNSMTGGMGAPQQPQPQGDTPQFQQAPSGGESPLDQFLPNNDNGTEGQGQQQPVAGADNNGQPSTPVSIFDNKPDDYLKLASAQDYASTLTPETMQQIMNGDVQAFAAVLNDVGRRAFAQAAFASGRVANTGIKQQLEQYTSGTLSQMLQDNNFQNAYQSNDHAILKHPAVAPLVQTQMQAFRNQFPTATPQEIQAKVVEYFNTVGKAFVDSGNGGGQPASDGTFVGDSQPQSNDLETLFNI